MYSPPGSKSYTILILDPHRGQNPRVAKSLDRRCVGSSWVQVMFVAEKSAQVCTLAV
ncbi:hypothetical protein AFLA70_13g006041 [Aspergillus flavus AF70]|nr:hypothetical protein AFLA70_13g006041 [Aspergillus flavus AF70]